MLHINVKLLHCFLVCAEFNASANVGISFTLDKSLVDESKFFILTFVLVMSSVPVCVKQQTGYLNVNLGNKINTRLQILNL